MTREEILAVYEQGPEAVVQLVSSLFQIIEDLHETVQRQEKRISELEKRLGKDSHNSSKPPSTDGFRKAPKSLRSKGKNKSGGQKGHRGTTLEMMDQPDEIHLLPLTRCSSCGSRFSDSDKTIEKRQVFELPELTVRSIEYQCECATCSHCGEYTKAEFPEDVTHKTQYGPNFRSLLVYLNQYQLIPYGRLRELFFDIFNWKISEGTINNTIKSCYEALAKTEDQIKSHIMESPCVGFDESGAYIHGQREWFHVARTPTLTWYGVHERRGSKAMDTFGILSEFKGAALHDFYRSYFQYDCEHYLCNAHILRELIYEHEANGQKWASSLMELLVAAKDEVERFKERNRKSIPKKSSASYNLEFDKIVQRGLRKNPRPPPKPNQRGRPKQSSTRNLLDRLKKYKESYLMFMYDFRIPFDNNGSERDIRMLKVQQKISGTFRSKQGANYFARIRGFISTVRKNSIKVADAISAVFTGNADAFLDFS